MQATALCRQLVIMDNGEDLINDPRLTVSPSQARKRPCNQDKWAKSIAKRKRNSGMEYISPNTKKTMSARTIGVACTCKMDCFNKVGMDNIESIFNDFWGSGCWDTQTNYILCQTKVNPVKRHRNNQEHKKSCTREYSVKVPGVVKEIIVCKKAFASIHGITVSRIDRAQENKTPSNVPIKDRRGKFGHHNQLSINKKVKVLKHILQFPTITSHYSRKSCPHVKYLEAQITAYSHMHELYKEWLIENYENEVPVTKSYYENFLKKHFPHLKLYVPRSDTCRICDQHVNRMKDTSLSSEDRAEAENIHKHHLMRAEKGYELPKKLLEMCK